MSKAQQLAGYPIPAVIDPENNRCIIFTIPDDDDYHRVAVAQMSELGKWWKWKRTNEVDKHAKFSAERFRDSFDWTKLGEQLDCKALDEGAIVTTAEELCEAIECGIINVFSRAISGDTSNTNVQVSFDENGVPIITGDAGSGLSRPDGATNNQVLYAQAYSVGEGFAGLIEQIITRRVVSGDSAQDTVDAIRRLYKMQPIPDPNPDPLLTIFDAGVLSATNEVTPVVNPNDIALIVFCKDADGFALQTYAQNLKDGGGTDANDIANWYFDIIQQLQLEQITEWYDDGAIDAREGYQDAECYRLPVQEFQIVGNNSNTLSVFPLQGLNMLNNRRYLIRWYGKLVDSNGKEFDGIYQKSGTNISYTPMYLGNAGGGGTRRYPQTQPQYKATTSQTDTYVTIYNAVEAEGVSNAPFVTGVGFNGTINLIITDLGKND